MENKEPLIDLTNPSSIENVDFAFYDWLNESMNLFCSTKDGSKKVPIIWVTPERAFQVKQNREFRDINGALNPPMITVERNSITKDVKNNGTYFTSLPPKDNRFLISRRINQSKSSEFANADYNKRHKQSPFVSPKTKNKKIVYEYSNMLLPIYATFTYNLSVFTQFQQQMNEILQPFITRFGSTKYFLIERDGYKYECFIEQNFDNKNNINSMDEEERRYITNINIKVLAVLVSDGANEEQKVIKTFENPVEIKFPKESIILAKEEKLEPIKEQLLVNIGTQISSNVAIKKLFTIGNGNDFQYIIRHNLNTRDMYISVRENFGPDYSKVEVGVTFDSLNQLTVDMGEAIPNDSFVVTIIG